MRQTELGKRLGVSFQQVQKYENGSAAFTVAKLYAIAVALDVDMQIFIYDLPRTRRGDPKVEARAILAASPQGVRLLDMYLALSPHQRRMSVGMMTALAECRRALKEDPSGGEPD
jgi:transcriptional regulator with XRE-family HTH domain